MVETVKELVQDHFDIEIAKIKVNIDTMLKNVET